MDERERFVRYSVEVSQNKLNRSQRDFSLEMAPWLSLPDRFLPGEVSAEIKNWLRTEMVVVGGRVKWEE